MNGGLVTRRPTSYDVARRAGVAQSTVSRCFAGDTAISDVTRERVRAAAAELGYTPNALARSLIRQRSDLIGLVIARYTLRASPDVIHALGVALSGGGKRVMLLTVERDHPDPAELASALEYPLEGLISCVLLAEGTLDMLARRRIPLVYYNRLPVRDEADCVAANNAEAAGELAEALLAAGHRRFLCLAGPPTAFVSRLRATGFTEALRRAGIRGTREVETDYTYEGGRTAVLAELRRGKRPDAVFCTNDQIAMGVLDACRYELGLSVPADLSVAGFDDVAEAARPPYALTTFSQDPVRMAQQAVELMLARLQSPKTPPVHVTMRAKLIARGTARLEQRPT